MYSILRIPRAWPHLWLSILLLLPCAGAAGEMDLVMPDDDSESPDAEHSDPEPADATGSETVSPDDLPDPVRERLSRVGEYDHPPSPATVYHLQIEGEISKPIEYILRRGTKDAIAAEADVILLEIDTPGGRLDVTLEIMEILSRFPGETLAYVNDEAVSAGAYISAATDDIYFAPRALIGSAAVVAGGGQEIPPTIKEKINSYLRAKVRTVAGAHPYRADVIRAMMDENFELRIDDAVIKPAGELLSLTAPEAMERYGEPPIPLLGRGIYDTIEALLETRYGVDNYELVSVELTWSEGLARYMAGIAPVLLGIGLLLLFIEFKTPGFGVFGFAGIVLLLVVFASNYVAGLAGYEPVLLFFLGVILVIVEIFLFPGLIVFAFLGILCILGALLWSLTDVWPSGTEGDDGTPFQLEIGMLLEPLQTLGLSLLVMIAGLIIIWRFLPQTSVYGKLVLQSTTGPANPLPAGGASTTSPQTALPEPGAVGVAVTDLFPHGEIEIDGQRYQAAVSVGSLERGTRVEVEGRRNFYLLVRRIDK